MIFYCGFEFEYKYPDFFSDKKGIREKFLYLFCIFFQSEKRVESKESVMEIKCKK